MYLWIGEEKMSSTKNANSNTNSNDYIDLLEIAKRVWTYKLPILALALAGMIIMTVKVQFMTRDTYSSSGILYVSNRNADVTTTVSQSDINTSISMNATYIEILKTRSFLTDISEDIEGKYSWGQIGGMVSVAPVNETQLMRITATAHSAEDAYLIAESILRNAPKKLSSIFTSGEIEVVDNAVMPSAPRDKGLTRKALTGALAGVVLGVAIVVLIGFFDKKIHKSEDVARRYNVSVLGDIAQ